MKRICLRKLFGFCGMDCGKFSLETRGYRQTVENTVAKCFDGHKISKKSRVYKKAFKHFKIFDDIEITKTFEGKI